MSNQIPEEIRQLDSWMLGTVNKVPQTVKEDGRWVTASPMDAVNWLPYETVVEGCKNLGGGSLPGFVLHDGHPYAVIDLDVKDADNESDSSRWTTDETLEMFRGIVDYMGSYAEVSRSGKGMHIIVRVEGKGDRKRWPVVKKGGVEVYFRDRYIVTTGNHIEGTPLVINDATEKVAAMLRHFAPEKFVERQQAHVSEVDGEQVLSDDEVLDDLESCGKAELYLSLMDGDWEDEYNSQSEADMALMEGIYFFSGNREQTARIFMKSKLANRDKAQSGLYVRNTVNKVAAKVDLDESEVDVVAKNIDMMDFSRFNPLDKKYDANLDLTPGHEIIPLPAAGVVGVSSLHGNGAIGNDRVFVVGDTTIDLSLHATQASLVNAIMAANPPAGTDVISLINMAEEQRKRCLAEIAAKYCPLSIGEASAPSLNDVLKGNRKSPYKMPQGFGDMPFGIGDDVDIEIPKGLLGDIIRWGIGFSYKRAKEATVAVFLGYLSGIIGKAWQVGDMGLNNYVVCIGKSAVGKSSAGDAVEMLHRCIVKEQPQAHGMLRVGYPASDKGVLRNLEENDSLSYRFDEFVKFIAQATSGKNAINKGILDVVMTMYDKASHIKVVGEVSHSKKENNIVINKNVGLSFFGDGVADDYYRSLNGQMISDGMTSRFTVIEYTGIREYSNRNRVMEPPTHIVNKLVDIVSNAIQLNLNGNHVQVKLTAEASVEFDRIDRETDDIINAINIRDRFSKLPNFVTRRPVKILRIAAIMAVLDNHEEPSIDIDHIHWARHVIDQCVARELWWVRQGAVNGVSDDAVIDDLFLSKIREFIEKPFGDTRTIELAGRGVVQLSSLRDIAQGIQAIADHKFGLTDRYKTALKSLCEIGKLSRYSKRTAKEKFGVANECYVVVVDGN